MKLERDSRKIVQRLAREGFAFVSASGSHHKYRREDVTIIVPHPKKDLPIGTARSIARLAGWLEGNAP
jgi:predicted RNA binding protein YcfA (HicA-like mRNA interferase family)